MLFSLSYGVLHTLDFSHGKVVIATYLATHPGAAKKQPEAYHLCRFTGAGVGGDRDGDVNAGGFTAFFPTIALQQLLAGKGSFILVMLFGTLLS